MKICVTKGIRSLFVIIFMLLSICLTGFAQSAEDEGVSSADQVTEAPEENTNPDETAVPQEEQKVTQPLAAEGEGTNGFIKSDFQPGFENKEIIPKAELYTGAATYSVPIVVPPGRGGIAVPNLALVYNNQNKNGLCGMGWDLNLGYIQRSTKKGLDYTKEDFIFNETPLVPIPNETDTYMSKVEGDFTKFIYHGDCTSIGPGYNGWEAIAKDGTRYFYGAHGDIQKHPVGNGNCSNVFKWYLSEIWDSNGNKLKITYYTYDEGQKYPQYIEYSGNGEYFYNKVAFDYYNPNRPDKIVSYEPHFKVKTDRLLRYIKTYANNQTTPTRTYELTYEEGENTNLSRLEQIEISTNPIIDLTPISFNWKGGGGTVSFNSANEFQVGSPNNDLCVGVADTNKDYKPDLLIRDYNISNGILSINTYLGTGTGTFSTSPQTTELEGGIPSDIKVWYEDINNDGKIDVLQREMSGFDLYIYCYLGIGNGKFNKPSQKTLLPNTSKKIYLVDINGDNSADVIQQDNSILTKVYIYFSNRNGTFNTTGMKQLTLAYNSDKIKFADLNNDGNTDIIQQNNTDLNDIDIHLSKGDGYFEPRKTITLEFSSDLIWFADFNGDGLVDIAQKKQYSFTDFIILISKGDATFEALPQFDLENDSNDIWMADINGDGRADVFQANDFNHSSFNFCYLTKEDGSLLNPPIQFSLDNGTYDLQFVDLNGDGLNDITQVPSLTNALNPSYYTYIAQGSSPDYLIETINNGLGGTATIEYKPSFTSTYANEYLPIKVQTVSKITTNDGRGNSSITSYTYNNGFYDVTEREFRGFKEVTQINPNSTTEKTTFNQKDYYLKGRIEKVETKNSSGGALVTITNTWAKESLGGDYFRTFVKLNRKLTENFFSPTVSIQEDFTYYNTHGGVWTQITSSPSHPSPESITKTYEYQNYGTVANPVWRTIKETLTGSVSGQVRETYSTYYSTTGNLWTKTSWEYGKTVDQYPKVEMTYDSYGNVTSVKDALGNITYTEYESTSTYPDKITAPPTTFAGRTVNHITEALSYDYNCGKPTQTRDENLNVTSYVYDALGRLTQVNQPDGGQIFYTYYDSANPRYILTQTKEANSQYINKYEYYDGLNRKYQTIVDGAYGENGEKKSIVSNIYYDNMGRIWKEEGPYYNGGQSPFVKKEFDLFGRVIWIRSPENESDATGNVVTGISYAGLETTTTDPDSKQKKETKDYLGRIIKITEDAGTPAPTGQFTTNYTYNAAGDLRTITDHEGNIITMVYDTLGRKTSMSHPDLGNWSYTYDKNNNLLTQTDAKNQVVTFGYDVLNRMISKQYSTFQTTVLYIYDNDTTGLNGIGRLYATIQDTNPAVLKGFKTENTYDVAGKPTSVLYPDSSRFYYQYYPGTGLLKNVLGADQATVYANLCLYEPTEKIGQVTSGNNVKTRYTYDQKSTRLTGIVTENQASVALQNRAYSYSKAGDITQVQDFFKIITYTYTYDNLHRLKGETINGGTYAPVSYTYSPTGNILTKTVGTGAPTFTYAYTLAKKHAVTRITYSGNPYDYAYDPNGNMTQGPDFTNLGQITQRRAAYDTDNMPTQVWASQSGVTTYFSYDGDGDRVKKTTPGGATIYYVGDHYEVKNDEALKYIFAGNLRLIMIKGNNTFYYHKDHLGSTSVMTNNSGAVVETAQYEPFGATRDHTGTDMGGYKFTDQELDNETNLYNYDARLYDPVIGRFGTADSIIQDWYDPQTINAYSYCRNNPLIYTDPSGFIPSLEEALEMANHIYKGKKGDSLSGGWEMVNAFTLSKSCYIGLYYRELQDGSNEFAIVNRGTHAFFSLQMGDNLTNLVQPFGLSDDMIQNIAQPFGLSKDMKLSIEFARNFAKTNSGAETTYVGHSKGGAESAGMAVATNGNAILVNPATINLKAYGLDSSQYSGNMTACIVVGEVLNKAFGPISKPIGKVRYLSLPDKNLIQKHYSKSALEAFLSEN